MNVLGSILILLGTLLLVVSALGLFRLHDALARQHAATKSATLSLGLILLGVALIAGDGATWLRVVLIVGLLLLTLPVSSHMLGRAAAHEHYRPDELASAPRIDASSPPPASSPPLRPER